MLSPLAEKRVTLFTIKKQMIGRRAYTDSIYKKTTHVLGTKSELCISSSSSSTSSSPKVSPMSSPSTAELADTC